MCVITQVTVPFESKVLLTVGVYEVHIWIINKLYLTYKLSTSFNIASL